MDRYTPSLQDLTDFFFDRCPVSEARKIEKWIRLHGNSEEGDRLLYELWENVLDLSGPESSEDTSEAFAKFKRKLGRSQDIPNRKTGRIGVPAWIYKIAAAMFIPLAAFSTWQAVLMHDRSDVGWTSMTVPYGSTEYVALPDGTEVWLNSGSMIVYPDRFLDSKRSVFFSGEAYFDVAHDKRKPFEISTGESKVKVLGTEFNLKSYDEDRKVELSLIGGSVLFTPGNDEDKAVRLQPGETVCFDKSTSDISRQAFDIAGYSSWRDGKLYFKNCRLSEIVRQLERVFDVEMVIMTDSLKTIPYHMAFVNNESLDDILAILDSDSRIRIEKRGRIIEIY